MSCLIISLPPRLQQLETDFQQKVACVNRNYRSKVNLCPMKCICNQSVPTRSLYTQLSLCYVTFRENEKLRD